MAAMLWPPHAAFVGLVWLLLSCRAESSQCPSGCTCLGNMVDCSKRELTEIPPDLPYWVTILELQSNAISSIPNSTFEGLTQLEELDLSNNQLDTLDEAVLRAVPSLKKLKLAYNLLTAMPYLGRNANLTHLILNHNSISAINFTVLDNLPNLRTLDLNFNRITALPLHHTFPLHASLHQLFLNNNKITALEVGSLNNLTSLEWLKLKRNKIQRLPKDLFLRLGKLKSLDLAQNKIRTIDGLIFDGLKNLTSLKLRRNDITELMDGAFYGLSSIQHLQLDNNNISRVSRGWLYGLSPLHQLSLSHNRISEVEQEAWEWCQRLWQLNLSHNHLVALMDDTFSHLDLLKFLYLENNRISYIGERAFTGLTSLQTLELSGNDISWTVEDMNGAFDGLESLSRLGLDSNRIKSIAKRAFQGLGQLKQLHLVDNDISSIQSNAFSPILQLRELHFNSTNLLCDCQLSWLPHWLTEAGFRETVNARCSHPDTLKGKSIFEVRPQEFMCNDTPKPVIIIEPESVVALRGSNVSLSCAAASSSTSELTIQWKKDNVLIASPTNVETLASTTDGQLTHYTSIMHMRDVQNTEEGRYQCVISNDFGSTYSQKARITVHVYPSFTKTPEDFTVRAEGTARLECAATGHPAPVIAWQKDGGDDFPAARERRMHVMPSDDVFFIVNVKSFDQGVYSCTATNDAGTIVANATVNVLETPAFIRPMESKVAEIGSTSVLECMASGSPKPKLLWFKDDQLLQPSERHFFTADDQLLIIVQTRPSDAGRYVCEMSNTLGTERGIASLKVIPLNEDDSDLGYDDGSTTTGIIIISVVCCVVGTSLIWVIIIYQTRKKTEEYSSTPTDETTLPGEIASPFHADKEAGSTPNHLQTFGNNSIGALHRLPGSDSDTLHSSSPSTHSTRSTHSTGLMQTFHPPPVVVSMAPPAAPAAPPSMEYGQYVQREPAVALIHAVPGTEGMGAEDGPGAEGQHAPRPPDQLDKGGGTLPRVVPSFTSTSTLSPQSHTKDLERSSIINPPDLSPGDGSGCYEPTSPADRDSADCRTALLSGADSDHDNPHGYGAHADPDNQNSSLLASAEPANHDTGLIHASPNPDAPQMSAANQNSGDVQEEPPGRSHPPPGASHPPPASPSLPSIHPKRSKPHVVHISHDSERRDSPSPTVIPNHVPPLAPPMVVLPHRTVAPAGV